MKKRVVSVFLALVMCLSLLPTAALADETAYVAEVTVNGETTKYADFSKAADAATGRNANNSTLKLLADTEVPKSISLSARTNTWTFDLNGKTLTQTGGTAYYFLQFFSGNVTIQDSGGGGKVIGLERAISAANSNITLNITGGTFVGKNSNGLIVDGNSATVSLSGGTFYTENKDEQHSIWYSGGDVADLLGDGYRYQNESGAASGFSENKNGVVGKTTVALAPLPGAEISYIGSDGTQAACQNFKQVTGTTATLTAGWYAVTSNTSISDLTADDEVNLILCDGATLTVSGALTVTGTLNLYFQQNGTGKLTAGSTTGTITAPAGGMRTTTDTAGVTYEKCLLHTWNYTQNTDGETHTKTCALCGKDGGTAAHSYTGWTADESGTTHTGACVDCGAEKMEDHTLSWAHDDTSHWQVCETCKYRTAAAAHTFGDNSICTACGANQTATEVNVRVTLTLADGSKKSKDYTNLLDAFDAARLGEFIDESGQKVTSNTVDVQLLDENKSYTLVSNEQFPISFEYRGNVIVDLNGCTLKRSVADDTYGILKVEEGDVTIKNGTLDLDDSASEYNPAQAIKMPSDNSSTLTLENMTVKVADIKAGGFRTAKGYAIRAEGGTLNIKSGTYGKIYINNYNSAKAQLSGGSYESVACNKENAYAELLAPGYIFAKQSDGSYIDPGTMKNEADNENIKNIKVIPCTHGVDFVDGKCPRCGLTCTKHEHSIGGKCKTCGQALVANDYSGNYYVSLNEAFANVADKAQISVLIALPEETLTFNRADRDVTLELLNSPVKGSADNAATLTVESGKLTVINGMEGSTVADYPAVITNNGKGYAVSVTGGTLAFGGKATLTGGLQVIKGGKLDGGLKEGSILIAGTGNAMEGESGSSVSVRDSVNNQSYGVVLDLLGEGLAFAKYDKDTKATGDIVSGNEPNLTEDVIVVKHQHAPKAIDNPDPDARDPYIYVCDCGYICPHNSFGADHKCTSCGAECTHDAATKTNADGNICCALCGLVYEAIVDWTDAVGISYSKGYASAAEALKNAPDGSSIKLQKNVHLPESIRVEQSGAGITLDLNGHSLSGSALKVGGVTVRNEPIPGKLTVIDSSHGNGSANLEVSTGGELVFNPGNNQTKLTLAVYDGTVKLYGGRIQRSSDLTLGSSVKMTDLLPEGYAYHYYNGQTHSASLLYSDAAANNKNSWLPAYELVPEVCVHAGVDDTGHCLYCNAAMTATLTQDGKTTGYATLAAAVEAANKTGGEITLLQDVTTTGTITISGSNITLGLKNHKLLSSGNFTILHVTGNPVTVKNGTIETAATSQCAITLMGTLTLENVTAGSVSESAVKVNSGSLTVNGGTYSGLCVYDSATSVTLNSGVFMPYKKGSSSVYVMAQGGQTSKRTCADLLAAGHAFAETGESGAIVNGYVPRLTQTVTIAEHTHHMKTGADGNYSCECGFICAHTTFTNGVCDACGYVCPHTDVETDTDTKAATCTKCHTEMAVKVEYNGTTTYYARATDSRNTENTLQTLLNDDEITPSGCTVTLLADGLNAFAHVQRGKTITLELNGKRLIETANGICTYKDNPDNKLIVTGTGHSEENKSFDYSRVFAVYGGTLEFDSGFDGEFNKIYVDGGTLTFAEGQSAEIHTLTIAGDATITPLKSGKFGKIVTEGSVTRTAGSLLDKTSGSSYAFRHTTGDTAFVPYNTVITKDEPVENVEIVYCEHGSIDEAKDSTCIYCGLEKIVAIVTGGSGKNAYCADNKTADEAANYAFSEMNSNIETTVTLYADVTIDAITLIRGTNTSEGHTYPRGHTIDLNGHAITGGTLTVSEDVTLTITDGSANKGSFSANVTVNVGGTLVVDGVKMGSVTLNQGCTFTDKGGFYGSVTAVDGILGDYLPEGHAFADADGNVKDSRAATLENVKIVSHTDHSYAWDTATHELVCACGHAKETDTTAPTISGIADGETYYQNTLTFTITDATSGVKEVKDGDSVLTADEGGNYTITADNKAHTITATDNAGNTVTVTVTAYKVYEVTLPTGTGYTVEGDPTVGHGQDYTFKVTIAEGYSATDSFAVKVNGETVTAAQNGGTYTCAAGGDKVTSDLTITVEGIADITAPDTEIKIGDNSFKTFLNTFTFGLFFKKTQTVTVSATDSGSGVDKVEYLLSIDTLNKDNLPADGWKSIRLNNGTGSFSIEPNTKASVYVRATDKDGNTTVINSDGVVVYTDSTAVTESISFKRLSDEDVSFKVNLNDNWFDRLLISDGKTTSSINGIVSSDGTITLNNSELKKLAAGEYTITVAYNPMGESYVEANGNDAPAATTVKLTVLRNTRTLEFSAPDAVYDGAAYDDLRITDKPSATAVRYKAQGAADSTYTTDAPKDVGSYTVEIYVEADADYNARTFTANFTISPREVTLTGGISAESRVYEKGNTAVTLTKGSLTFAGLAEGETLNVTLSGGTIRSADAGENKPVTYTAALADGTGKASNYKLVGSLPTVAATIQKASAPTLTDVARSQKYHITTACTASVAGTGMPADAGALTYTAGTPSVTGAATASFTVDENGLVTYTITGGAKDDTITLPVTIGSVNYADATVNVVVTLEDKDPQPDFAFAQTALTKTYGDAAFTVTATGNVTGSSVSYTSSDTSVATLNSATGEVTITGAGTAAITATASETADHRVATTTYALTVDPKTLTRNDLTRSGPIAKVYDTTINAPAGLSVSVKPEALVNGDMLPITGTLVYNSANVNEANTITFTPNAVTTGNYRLAESEVLTITGAKITPAPHNCANPTGLTAKYGQKLSDVTLTNPEGNLPGTWSWQNPGTVLDQVGTQNYSANFKPESPNYQEVKNAEIAVAVGKADAPTLADTGKSQKYTVTSGKVTVNTAGMPADAGTLTYTAGTPSVKGAATASFTVDENGLVTYTITGGAAGDTITLPVTIGSVNYADATANVVITLLPRDDQDALTIIGGDTVVYGQTLTFSATGGSGSGKVTYSVASGTGEAAIDADTGVLIPVKVGAVKVKAIKAADMDFNEVTSNEIEVTITPATPTGEPKYTKITSPGKTLADADLTVTDSTLNPNAGTLEWLDDEGKLLPDDTKVKANKTYTWRFTPDDTNYTTLTGEIELYRKSSSGGGGSSGYSYYTIQATAGTGGAISPSGNVSVREGRDQIFTITPDKGYAVSNVKIDGKSIGAVKSYTFENVSRTHTIEVVFMKANGNPQTGVFVDVATGSYYEDAVDWAVENGITKGTDDTHFSPDGICTRAQAVTFLWRASGSPKPETRTMPFTDVPTGSYYYDAVLWAVENGITEGTSDTTFSPNSTCTRAQIVAFLWRSEKSPAAGSRNPFADVKSSAYYADAVLWAVENDITKGTTNTTFSPNADCTRAQIVTFLWRCKK